MASNTNKYAISYQCNIERLFCDRWGLIYWKINRYKVVNNCGFSEMLFDNN